MHYSVTPLDVQHSCSVRAVARKPFYGLDEKEQASDRHVAAGPAGQALAGPLFFLNAQNAGFCTLISKNFYGPDPGAPPPPLRPDHVQRRCYAPVRIAASVGGDKPVNIRVLFNAFSHATCSPQSQGGCRWRAWRSFLEKTFINASLRENCCSTRTFQIIRTHQFVHTHSQLPHSSTATIPGSYPLHKFTLRVLCITSSCCILTLLFISF